MGKGLTGGKTPRVAKLMVVPELISQSPNTERARELVSSLPVSEGVSETKADAFPHHCLSHRGDEQLRKVPFQKFPIDL